MGRLAEGARARLGRGKAGKQKKAEPRAKGAAEELLHRSLRLEVAQPWAPRCGKKDANAWRLSRRDTLIRHVKLVVISGSAAVNILILGGGGREHALAWAVKQNPKTDRLIAAPGNPGVARIAECAALDILDGDAVAAFCGENAVDLVIVGPEAPLATGVADRLRAAEVLVLGPSREAAQLEASKAFTKEVCDACGAPTARWAAFTDLLSARAHVEAEGAPIVV